MTAEPQLCLSIEISNEVGNRNDRLAAIKAAIETTEAATLIIAPLSGANLDRAAVHPFVELAQKHGCAALIKDNTSLALSSEADGVHLSWRDDSVVGYAEARARLGTSLIVGVDAGHSQHNAMILGEKHASYIAFGIPPQESDRESAEIRRLELVAWWAEIFEVPVVATSIRTPPEAARLVAAGADFLTTPPLPQEITPEDARTWASEWTAALSQPVLAG
jgi:thiamine-phosphate pyrophosphorylase